MFGYLAFAAFGTFKAFRISNALKNIIHLAATTYFKYNLFNSQTQRLSFKRNTLKLVRCI